MGPLVIDHPSLVPLAAENVQLQLSALRHLKLSSCSMSPGILARTPQLQSLQLYNCTLLPRGPNSWSQPEGVAALLTALPALACLQDLQLLYLKLDSARPPFNAFSALTASSQLTSLQVEGYCRPALPQGALPHCLPDNKQLPQLRKLILGQDQDDAPLGRAYMEGEELTRIFRCLPNLEELGVTCSIRPDCHYTVLTTLLDLPRSCSSLDVGGDAFGNGAAAVVAQITELTNIRWSSSNTLTDAGLECLTALTNLQRLTVQSCPGISEEVANEPPRGGWSGFVTLEGDDEGEVGAVDILWWWWWC